MEVDMKRSAIVMLAAFMGVIAAPGAARAQFLPEELAQRPAQEEFLRTAEIVKAEPIGEGVTKPYKLTLRKDGVEMVAAWKNPKGIQFGYLEGWQYEIAAYRLDKLIGLGMVPPAVERDFQGKPGALVLWAKNKYSLLKVMDDKIPIPAGVLAQVENMKYLARAWDSLVANEDRTQQNVLYTDDWRTILFDHSRAFRSTGKFVKRLMFGRNGLLVSDQGTPYLFQRLPRRFVDNIKALTFEAIRQAVGDTLTDREIRAILIRRDLILTEVHQMIAERGEKAVLY
jgi:hypothetical protein